MPARALNLLVFREARRLLCGAELKATLIRELAELPVNPSHDRIMAGLLSAGSLECAVADADDALAQAFALVTDCLAEALLRPRLSLDGVSLARSLSDPAVPGEV